jgi:Lantibiotic biosynthesis dehydratase C-term
LTGPVWVSAHVFRHDDLDDLLLTQIAPLMSELVADGLVLDFFYLRYWDGGPHLRLRMLAAPEHTSEVSARVTDRLGAHVRANPSRRPMDQAGYARLAAGLADLEGMSGYECRLLPPDTIRFVPYPPEYASFGHGPSLATVERHFGESTTVALDTLRKPLPQRLSAALAMTMATLLTLPAAPDGTPNGTPDGSPPARFDTTRAAADWTRSRDELIAMAERLRTIEPDTAPHIPELAWLRSVRDLRDRLAALRLQGGFSVTSPRPVTHALNRCLHLHLNRLGTSLAQEARLRRMAVLTIDALR